MLGIRNQRGVGWDSGCLVQGREASVVAHFGFVASLGLRVMLGPLYLLLSEEGSRVRSTAGTRNRVQHDGGWAHIDP